MKQNVKKFALFVSVMAVQAAAAVPASAFQTSVNQGWLAPVTESPQIQAAMQTALAALESQQASLKAQMATEQANGQTPSATQVSLYNFIGEMIPLEQRMADGYALTTRQSQQMQYDQQQMLALEQQQSTAMTTTQQAQAQQSGTVALQQELANVQSQINAEQANGQAPTASQTQLVNVISEMIPLEQQIQNGTALTATQTAALQQDQQTLVVLEQKQQ